MKYAPPIGQEAQGETAHYIDGNPELGILGSPVPAAALEPVQRELVHVIRQAGLDPTAEDLTQLWQAISRMTGNGILTCDSEGAEAVKEVSLPGFAPATGSRLNIMFSEVNSAVAPQLSVNGDTPKPLLFDGVSPEVGDLAKNHIYTVALTGPAWQIMSGMARDRIGQTVWFEDTLSRPGYVPLNGTTVANFAATWPQMAAYLATAHGQERCFESLAEREAAHVAIWHTLASGATVGWEGFGGVCKFYYDPETDTLYMPDLRGMFRAMAGDGSRAPSMSEVLGDRILNIWGVLYNMGSSETIQEGDTGGVGFAWWRYRTGYWTYQRNATSGTIGPGGLTFDASAVVPVGAANVPRSWGALACAYFGQPSA